MPRAIPELKKSLSSFINHVREVCSTGEATPAEQLELEGEYRKLHFQYRGLGSDQINKHFSPDEIRVMNFLELGLAHGPGKIYQAMASLFSEDASLTAKMVAEFLKTEKAFDLVNSQADIGEASKKKSKGEVAEKGPLKLSAQDEAELIAMFGSVLGVQLSATFVRSLKAEEMGRIFGYALSGLSEDDMKAWNDPAEGKILRQSFKSVDEYLMYKIQEADKLSVFRFEADFENGQYKAAFRIFESLGADNEARKAFQTDHCFVRYAEDGSGTITLGTSTAKSLAPEHAYSFAQAVLAAKAMVKEKKINGIDNPYYGFKVQSFCCFAGMMKTVDQDGNVIRSKIVQMLESGRTPAQGKLSARQVKAVARMPFLSFLTSTDPSPLIERMFHDLNPAVLGCDTLPLYEALVHEGRERSVYSNSRKNAVYLLQQVARVADLLAQDNVTLDLQKHGSKEGIQAILDALPRITQNYFKIFPIKENQHLKSSESSLLSRIGQSFEKISEKIAAEGKNHLRLDLSGTYAEEAEVLLGRLTGRISRDTKKALAVDLPVSHSDELYLGINLLKRFEGNQHVRKVAVPFKAAIAQMKGAAFFKPFLDEAKFQANPDHKAFVEDYCSCLSHCLEGKSNKDWKGDKYTDLHQLRIAAIAFVAREQGPVGSLVKATGPLLGTRGTGASKPLQDRLDQQSVKDAMADTVKALVGIALHSQEEVLIGLLKRLEKGATTKKGLGR